MERLKKFLKTANFLVYLILLVMILIGTLYAGYSLWDNYKIYSQADKVQKDMLRFKPDLSSEKSVKLSFEELRSINGDVCAWLTIDNTNIDYPVVHGIDNFEYVSKDVYGDFSLAGSIFLDFRCAPDFSDNYNIVYGHHMANSKMLGDLDKYKKQEFFENNKTGTLITPDKTFRLEIFSVILVRESDIKIFGWSENTDLNKFADYIKDNSLYYDSAVLNKVKMLSSSAQVVSVTTCSEEFSDARTVLIARMVPQK